MMCGDAPWTKPLYTFASVRCVTDAELDKIERLAEQQDKPLSTVVYEILARGLRRKK